MQDIRALRQTLRDKRRDLSDRERREKSLAIAGNVAQLSIFNNAKHIALYWPTSEEVSIFPLLDLAIEANKTCYLPVINTVDWRPAPMLFRPYHPGTSDNG